MLDVAKHDIQVYCLKFTILRPGAFEFTKEDTSLKCPIDQKILIIKKKNLSMFYIYGMVLKWNGYKEGQCMF